MKKVVIDKNCVACGACLFCNLFVENTEGVVSIKGFGILDESKAAEIDMAIKLCPTKSISIVEESKDISEIKNEILKEIDSFVLEIPAKKDFCYDKKYANFITPHIICNHDDFSSERKAMDSAISSFNIQYYAKRKYIIQDIISNYVADKAVPYFTFEKSPTNFFYSSNMKAQKILDKIVSYAEIFDCSEALISNNNVISSEPDMGKDSWIEFAKSRISYAAQWIIDEGLSDKYYRLNAYELYIEIRDVERAVDGFFDRIKFVTKYEILSAQKAAEELTKDIKFACNLYLEDKVSIHERIEPIIKEYNKKLKDELKDKFNKLLVQPTDSGSSTGIGSIASVAGIILRS